MLLTEDDVKRKTYSLISAFYRQFGIKPNTVYLGQDEYLALTDEYLRMIDIKNDTVQLFGLDVIRTTKDQYLSVGLSI